MSMVSPVGPPKTVTVTETPVDLLLREHRLHRRLLRVLERLAEVVEAGARFPADDAAVILNYCREFVETHHAKESQHLYPSAAMYGIDRVAEAVGELVAEKDESKLLLYCLTMFWEPGDLRDDERQAFGELVRTYSTRLRRQMAIEEREVFPAATDIPAAELDHMREQFTAIEANRRGYLDWLSEVKRLEAIYRDHA